MVPRVAMLALCLVPGLLTGWVFWHAWPETLLAPNHQLPVRDYLNLWGGGRLAAARRLDVVFDPHAYAGWLWRVFGHRLDLHSWGYPPHLLFVAIPLAHLPLVAGFLVWGLGMAGAGVDLAGHRCLHHPRPGGAVRRPCRLGGGLPPSARPGGAALLDLPPEAWPLDRDQWLCTREGGAPTLTARRDATPITRTETGVTSWRSQSTTST